MDDKHAFALFLFLKSKFENSRVYNYNPTSLAAKLKISRYLVSKYIGIIQKNNWGYYSKNDFVLYSFWRVMKSDRAERYKIQICQKETLKTLVEKINIIILSNNIQNQDKLSRYRSYYTNSNRKDLSLREYKKIKDRFDHSKHSAGYEEEVVIGFRRLSEILNCSIGYVSIFIKRLVKNKIISTKPVCRALCSNVGSAKFIDGFGYFYTHKNILYNYIGTNIMLLS